MTSVTVYYYCRHFLCHRRCRTSSGIACPARQQALFVMMLMCLLIKFAVAAACTFAGFVYQTLPTAELALEPCTKNNIVHPITILLKICFLCRYPALPFWVDQQLCLSSNQCLSHRQASLSSCHRSFHSRCSSSHPSLPSPALTALGRSMMMGQPRCNPRGYLPRPWDQPRPWDRQGPSLREHLFSLKVTWQLDLTWHVLRCYIEYVPTHWAHCYPCMAVD